MGDLKSQALRFIKTPNFMNIYRLYSEISPWAYF
jgi:hypothetical protein